MEIIVRAQLQRNKDTRYILARRKFFQQDGLCSFDQHKLTLCLDLLERKQKQRVNLEEQAVWRLQRIKADSFSSITAEKLSAYFDTIRKRMSTLSKKLIGDQNYSHSTKHLVNNFMVNLRYSELIDNQDLLQEIKQLSNKLNKHSEQTQMGLVSMLHKLIKVQRNKFQHLLISLKSTESPSQLQKTLSVIKKPPIAKILPTRMSLKQTRLKQLVSSVRADTTGRNQCSLTSHRLLTESPAAKKTQYKSVNMKIKPQRKPQNRDYELNPIKDEDNQIQLKKVQSQKDMLSMLSVITDLDFGSVASTLKRSKITQGFQEKLFSQLRKRNTRAKQQLKRVHTQPY